MDYSSKEDEFQDIIYEAKYEQERENAIQLLPKLEREVLEYTEWIEKKYAKQSQNLGDYMRLIHEVKPGEVTAKHFNITPDEVIEILGSATAKIKKMINSNN